MGSPMVYPRLPRSFPLSSRSLTSSGGFIFPVRSLSITGFVCIFALRVSLGPNWSCGSKSSSCSYLAKNKTFFCDCLYFCVPLKIVILTKFCEISSSGSPPAFPSILTLTLACVGSANNTPTVDDWNTTFKQKT